MGVKEDIVYIIMTGYKAGVNFERRCELMKLCGNQGNVMQCFSKGACSSHSKEKNKLSKLA